MLALFLHRLDRLPLVGGVAPGGGADLPGGGLDVPLGGGEAAETEQFHDFDGTGTVLAEAGGEGVPEGVDEGAAFDPVVDAGPAVAGPDQVLQGASRHPGRGAAGEQPGVGRQPAATGPG